MRRFSDRHGYRPDPADISVRHDAPSELRSVVVDIAYESGWTPTKLRTKVCALLRKQPDRGNWSDFPNVDHEVRELIEESEWYRVYDLIEGIFAALAASHERTPEGEHAASHFEAEINRYFEEAGVGWQLISGKIETRGSEAFQQIVGCAVQQLSSSGHATASTEIHEALSDLSRRPEPDITGAVQHALASLECVARTVTGDQKATLGTILARNPGLVPQPLNVGLEKLWGFASEQGRHLREGRTPEYEEAELAVQVSAAVGTYLSKRFGPPAEA
jgi:hypothetical protein